MGAPINKTVYKSISQVESQNRPMKPLTTEQRERSHKIMENFIKYMKAANS